MIQKISIKNYKSIAELEIELGRINVLIGENGCGKSNILEAIAMGCAAAANKLDNEFLVSRGIRVAAPQWMRAAFSAENMDKEIEVGFKSPNFPLLYHLQNDNQAYSSWHHNLPLEVKEKIDKLFEELKKIYPSDQKYAEILAEWVKVLGIGELLQFLIYYPENGSLRLFEQEGQIEPLGIKGEGLFKFLKYLHSKNKLGAIKERLNCLGWFADLDMPQNLLSNEKQIQIRDRYLDEKLAYFDQNCANEGFLFLLFYFCLFASEETPQFFAVDNIDASLNPQLCRELMVHLVDIAKKQGKQAILTTHNPCILDGLNLDDEEQRLFVVYRNNVGHTKVKRVRKPQAAEGQEPVPLSVAFIRGYIGGLPRGF
jgi:predicted ATPase